MTPFLTDKVAGPDGGKLCELLAALAEPACVFEASLDCDIPCTIAVIGDSLVAWRAGAITASSASGGDI
ncbi:hypothetical protein [uncultured Tateyamaria sp.]|uniref:hypothetical protein n=1 Tax=uncultured Tateyamaria sp. TaxID=455651 RepID=UPI00260F0289|nr:hypothetical protein [uncultured Tateyamaria sp.]